jgi:ubiquinone/menaquinone biosynthesis C-methylase UbiE
MQDVSKLIESIPLTDSDNLLKSWGYNLAAEYFEIINNAKLSNSQPILELATGTGRMSAVLTRLGYEVITGDISTEDREKAEKRITKHYLSKVRFVTINMENLPFENNSFSNVISMNTLHHLENPEVCIHELIRVHSGTHSLIIGDFNKDGFDALQKVHQILYKNDHSRGSLNIAKLKHLLEISYKQVREFHTNLNISYIASEKKI